MFIFRPTQGAWRRHMRVVALLKATRPQRRDIILCHWGIINECWSKRKFIPVISRLSMLYWYIDVFWKMDSFKRKLLLTFATYAKASWASLNSFIIDKTARVKFLLRGTTFQYNQYSKCASTNDAAIILTDHWCEYIQDSFWDVYWALFITSQFKWSVLLCNFVLCY